MQATVHGVAENRTRLSDFISHIYCHFKLCFPIDFIFLLCLSGSFLFILLWFDDFLSYYIYVLFCLVFVSLLYVFDLWLLCFSNMLTAFLYLFALDWQLQEGFLEKLTYELSFEEWVRTNLCRRQLQTQERAFQVALRHEGEPENPRMPSVWEQWDG